MEGWHSQLEDCSRYDTVKVQYYTVLPLVSPPSSLPSAARPCNPTIPSPIPPHPLPHEIPTNPPHPHPHPRTSHRIASHRTRISPPSAPPMSPRRRSQRSGKGRARAYRPCLTAQRSAAFLFSYITHCITQYPASHLRALMDGIARDKAGTTGAPLPTLPPLFSLCVLWKSNSQLRR